MIATGDFKDYDKTTDSLDLLPVMSVLRGEHFQVQDNDDQFWDELLNSQQVRNMLRKQTQVYNQRAMQSEGLHSDFVDLKRQSKANYVRDEFRYSPKFLGAE